MIMNKIIYKRFCTLMLVCFLLFKVNAAYAMDIGVGARSAILIDRQSGRVLYAKNSRSKMPMASTTKIMTALLAIKKGNLNTEITVPVESVGVEGSSIYLQYSERVLLRDLVYGLMLRSGNDAAVAIAHHIGKSVDNFVQMMNSQAVKIGANNTHFTNPNGLHHDKHYTTAYDLALITKEALSNPVFREIVKTKLWVAKREGYKYFHNKNKTLSLYKGGDGVKTGYTKVAGRCLVTSATRDNMQLIAVVLNDGNWFNDCFNMLDYGFNNYNAKTVFNENEIAKKINLPSGEKKYTNLIYKDTITIPIKDGEENFIKTEIKINENIQLPIKRGMEMGVAKVYLKDKLMGSTMIISREDIEIEQMQEKISKYFKEKIIGFKL